MKRCCAAVLTSKAVTQVIRISHITSLCFSVSLIFGTSVGVANENCDGDPDNCTPMQLCEASTTIVDGNTVWTDDPSFSGHVATSKSFGLNCGVEEIASATCDTNPELCTVTALCEQATVLTEPSSVRSWSDDKIDHVNLAIEYGLTCNVGEQEEPTASFAEALTDEDVCQLATQQSDGVVVWSDNLRARLAAEERSLTCGIITDEIACDLATEESGGVIVWKRDINALRDVVDRGLICEVTPIGTCIDGESFNGCYGTQTYDDGSRLIGSWSNNRVTGYATFIYGGEGQGNLFIGLADENGRIEGGPTLFVFSDNDAAHYEQNWDWSEQYQVSTNISEAFPLLTRAFEALPRDERIEIQESLKNKGLYDPDPNGLWGRDTLVGLVRFSAEYINTINLTSLWNVQLILDAVAEQASLDRTEVAQVEILLDVLERNEGSPEPISTEELAQLIETEYRSNFTSQPRLRRQQLQYALKELDLYSSSIDGVWGNGTRSALLRFVEENQVYDSETESVFEQILALVDDIPSAFAALQPTAPSRSTPSSNNSGGLTAIVSNPSMPGTQALSICRPQAELARRQGRSSYQAPSYGYSGNCNTFGGFANCNVSPNTGGFLGGFAEGMARGMQGRSAYDSVLASCLAQYGWRQ